MVECTCCPDVPMIEPPNGGAVTPADWRTWRGAFPGSPVCEMVASISWPDSQFRLFPSYVDVADELTQRVWLAVLGYNLPNRRGLMRWHEIQLGGSSQGNTMYCLTRLVVLTVALLGGLSTTVQAEQPVSKPSVSGLPRLKFFYFDQAHTEWVVSAEPDRLERHLEGNADSASLYQNLQRSLSETPDLDRIRNGMADWIRSERTRFDQAGSRVSRRVRVAEGVVAYMRAHDFDIRKLVTALVKRSGARDVELVAIHLVDAEGESSYKLKVVLPNDQVELGRQGFDVVLQSSQVTYTSAIYALAMALYEVHEVVNQVDHPDDEETEQRARMLEELPLPDFSPAAAPPADNRPPRL